MNIIKETITFMSNDFVLHGILHLPDAKNPPVVIGSHGLFSDLLSPKQINLAEKCSEKGIAYLRFDHRGCNNSSGLFKDVTTFDGRCEDMHSAIRFVLSRADLGDKVGLFGSSLGGAVCIGVSDMVDIKCYVMNAALIRSNTILKTTDELNSLRPFKYRVDGTKLNVDVSDSLINLHHILLFHGDKDEVVPFSDAGEILEYASQPKELIVLKDGDHQMANEEHQNQFIDQSVSWFARWLIP